MYKKVLKYNTWINIIGYLPPLCTVQESSAGTDLVPASECGPGPGGSWTAGHRCRRWCRRPAARTPPGQRCLWRSAGASNSSESAEGRTAVTFNHTTKRRYHHHHPSNKLFCLLPLAGSTAASGQNTPDSGTVVPHRPSE